MKSGEEWKSKPGQQRYDEDGMACLVNQQGNSDEFDDRWVNEVVATISQLNGGMSDLAVCLWGVI